LSEHNEMIIPVDNSKGTQQNECCLAAMEPYVCVWEEWHNAFECGAYHINILVMLDHWCSNSI
jgi:hypothetical protein